MATKFNVIAIGAASAALSVATVLLASSIFVKNDASLADDGEERSPSSSSGTATIDEGGYESLIGDTPLLYLRNISSLLPNGVNIYAKMESSNPGGTGKDRAALSMISDAETRGVLPPPLNLGGFGGGSTPSRRDVARMGADAVGVVANGRNYDGRDGDRCENNHTMEQPSSSGQLNDDDDRIDPSAVSSSSYTTSHSSSHDGIPPDVHDAILTALRNTRTHGILVEGTSGSTGISLASLSCTRGHGMIVVMPDDQSSQKYDFLRRLGAGVVVVRNCGISNPEHYVNVARRICEWLQVERRYDGWYWENVVGRGNRRKKDDDTNDAPQTHTCIDGEVRKKSTTSRRQAPKLLRAAFMNQFENLANIKAHYTTTGPEIYSQLQGRVDAFVMSAGTGGTLVGVGGYLKERWFRNHHHRRNDGRSRQLPPHRKDETRNRTPPPLVYLVDPPGSSLYNKIKFGVAYASQQSEQRLRRHRYDTLVEGIGLDRVTANFGLGCENISWDDHYREGSRGGGTNARPFGLRIESLMNATGRPCSSGSSDGSSSTASSKIIDDALAISDQQAVHMAHYLLRHEGLFVGSSTAMNIAGALMVASRMPEGSNVVTIVCDGGQRHTSRFWNRDFIVNEWGLRWPGDDDGGDEDINSIILDLLGIVIPDGGVPKR